jgi:DNA-binding phage protein
MCRHPNASLPQFNAQAMYNQNDTQDFMDKHLDDDDHKYIMQLAHIFDTSGFEKKRRKDLIDHAAKEAEANAVRIGKKQGKR